MVMMFYLTKQPLTLIEGLCSVGATLTIVKSLHSSFSRSIDVSAISMSIYCRVQFFVERSFAYSFEVRRFIAACFV